MSFVFFLVVVIVGVVAAQLVRRVGTRTVVS
jgi:hypothetical protein